VARSELALTPLAGTANSLAEKVMDRIRIAVHTGQLSPGVLYSAYQIAEELKVSRSPVREALLRLAEVGVVRLERNRGFRIIVPQPREIAEIFAIRLAIELPAVRRVARDADRQIIDQIRQEMDTLQRAALAGDEEVFSAQDQRLHDLVLAAAGNARARTIVHDLRETTRLLGATSADRSRSLFAIYAEHEPVVEAVTRGDADAAEAAMRWHLVHTGRLLVEQAARDLGGTYDIDQIWAGCIDSRIRLSGGSGRSQ